MSDMVEIDIDFDYCGEVEMILAHDECGEHDDVEFYRNDLLAAENAKLRELVRDYHTFLALAELAQPIGSVIAAHGHPTLSVKALDKRYRELEAEVYE